VRLKNFDLKVSSPIKGVRLAAKTPKMMPRPAVSALRKAKVKTKDPSNTQTPFSLSPFRINPALIIVNIRKEKTVTVSAKETIIFVDRLIWKETTRLIAAAMVKVIAVAKALRACLLMVDNSFKFWFVMGGSVA